MNIPSRDIGVHKEMLGELSRFLHAVSVRVEDFTGLGNRSPGVATTERSLVIRCSNTLDGAKKELGDLREEKQQLEARLRSYEMRRTDISESGEYANAPEIGEEIPKINRHLSPSDDFSHLRLIERFIVGELGEDRGSSESGNYGHILHSLPRDVLLLMKRISGLLRDMEYGEPRWTGIHEGVAEIEVLLNRMELDLSATVNYEGRSSLGDVIKNLRKCVDYIRKQIEFRGSIVYLHDKIRGLQGGLDLAFETVPDGNGEHPEHADVIRNPLESGLSLYWLGAQKIHKIRKMIDGMLEHQIIDTNKITRVLAMIDDILMSLHPVIREDGGTYSSNSFLSCLQTIREGVVCLEDMIHTNSGGIPRPPMSPADTVAGLEVVGLRNALEETIVSILDIDEVEARVDPGRFLDSIRETEELLKQMQQRLLESSKTAPRFDEGEEWRPGQEDVPTIHGEFQSLLSNLQSFLHVHLLGHQAGFAHTKRIDALLQNPSVSDIQRFIEMLGDDELGKLITEIETILMPLVRTLLEYRQLLSAHRGRRQKGSIVPTLDFLLDSLHGLARGDNIGQRFDTLRVSTLTEAITDTQQKISAINGKISEKEQEIKYLETEHERLHSDLLQAVLQHAQSQTGIGNLLQSGQWRGIYAFLGNGGMNETLGLPTDARGDAVLGAQIQCGEHVMSAEQLVSSRYIYHVASKVYGKKFSTQYREVFISGRVAMDMPTAQAICAQAYPIVAAFLRRELLETDLNSLFSKPENPRDLQIFFTLPPVLSEHFSVAEIRAYAPQLQYLIGLSKRHQPLLKHIGRIPLSHLIHPLASEKIPDMLMLLNQQETVQDTNFCFAMSPFLGEDKNRNKGILESGLVVCQEFFQLHRLTPDQFARNRDHVIHNINSLDDDTSVAFGYISQSIPSLLMLPPAQFGVVTRFFCSLGNKLDDTIQRQIIDRILLLDLQGDSQVTVNLLDALSAPWYQGDPQALYDKLLHIAPDIGGTIVNRSSAQLALLKPSGTSDIDWSQAMVTREVGKNKAPRDFVALLSQAQDVYARRGMKGSTLSIRLAQHLGMSTDVGSHFCATIHPSLDFAEFSETSEETLLYLERVLQKPEEDPEFVALRMVMNSPAIQGNIETKRTFFAQGKDFLSTVFHIHAGVLGKHFGELYELFGHDSTKFQSIILLSHLGVQDDSKFLSKIQTHCLPLSGSTEWVLAYFFEGRLKAIDFWRDAFEEGKKNLIPIFIASLSPDQRDILIERQQVFAKYNLKIHGNHMNFIRYILTLSEDDEPGKTLLSADGADLISIIGPNRIEISRRLFLVGSQNDISPLMIRGILEQLQTHPQSLDALIGVLEEGHIDGQQIEDVLELMSSTSDADLAITISTMQ